MKVFQIEKQKNFWHFRSAIFGCQIYIFIDKTIYIVININIIAIIIRDAMDCKITGYRISDNFFESDIRPDSEKISSKKKVYREKDCNFVTMYKIS